MRNRKVSALRFLQKQGNWLDYGCCGKTLKPTTKKMKRWSDGHDKEGDFVLWFELQCPPKAHVLSRLSPQPLVLWQEVNLQEIQPRGRKVVRYAVCNSLPFFPGGQEVSRAPYLQTLPMTYLLFQCLLSRVHRCSNQ